MYWYCGCNTLTIVLMLLMYVTVVQRCTVLTVYIRWAAVSDPSMHERWWAVHERWMSAHERWWGLMSGDERWLRTYVSSTKVGSKFWFFQESWRIHNKNSEIPVSCRQQRDESWRLRLIQKMTQKKMKRPLSRFSQWGDHCTRDSSWEAIHGGLVH